MMYWHFVRHGIRPLEWLEMGTGEQIILRAFMIEEIEAEREEEKRIKSMAKGGN